jgi:signal peptidase
MHFENVLHFRNRLLKGDHPTRFIVDGDTRHVRLGSALLGLSMAIYGMITLMGVMRVSPSLSMYIIEPSLWLLLALVAFLVWRLRLAPWFRRANKMLVLSLLLGVCQIIFLLAAGLLFGFGASPYSHELLPMLGNIVYVFPKLIAIELTRACLIHSWGKRSPTLTLMISIIWFSMLAMPRASLISVNDLGSILQFSAMTLLPILAANVLATQLAWSGGFLSSFTYLALLQAWEWFSPILPDLNWMTAAFIGTMIPALGMIIVQDWTTSMDEVTDANVQGNASSNLWLFVAGLAVLILYFNNGFLGIRPTVISGVSMQPLYYAGDVIVSRTVAYETLEVGDIIVFRQGDHRVVHRIINIQTEDGEVWFTTQGDNNNMVDPPVHADHVEGRVILHVPKIGWVSIVFRDLLDKLSVISGQHPA